MLEYTRKTSMYGTELSHTGLEPINNGRVSLIIWTCSLVCHPFNLMSLRFRLYCLASPCIFTTLLGLTCNLL